MAKRILSTLLCALLPAMGLFGCAASPSAAPAGTAAASAATQAQGEVRIAATMYPMYIYLANLTEGIEGVAIDCLTPPSGGCLHDYQLTTADMKVLSAADILVANGAGMEGFLADVAPQFPDLQIVEASEGYALLGAGEDVNAHVWVSPAGALHQLSTISQALQKALPQHAQALRSNAETYTDKLLTLQQAMQEKLLPFAGESVATLHNSFDYLMDEYRLEVSAVLMVDDETDPTPEQLEQSIAAIEAANTKALFMEPQYGDALCQTVSRETGVAVYQLDTVATGALETAKTAYTDAMQANLELMLQALQ